MSELSVITWNVRYFGHRSRGIRTSDKGFTDVAGAIAGLEVLPDVIALQEVETSSLRSGFHAQTQIERLHNTLQRTLEEKKLPKCYRSYYFPAHRYSAANVPLYTTGLAFLVSEHLDVLQHNVDTPHDITHRRFEFTAPMKQTRICAHLRVRDRFHDTTLDVFNTHLSLPQFFSRDLVRLPWRMGHGPNQVAEVERLLEFVDSHSPRHAVLMGDFNAAPDSPAYNAIVSSGLFRDAFHHPDTESAPWVTNGFAGLAMHVDHVFSTPSIDWIGFEDSHRYTEQGRFFGISDHVPKVGRLRIAT